MVDITVTALKGPHFKGTERELEIICQEIVASALNDDEKRKVFPGDVRVVVINGNEGELRHDAIIYVSDPEGNSRMRHQQVNELRAGLRQAFDEVLAGRTIATRFRASITAKPLMHAPRGLFDSPGPALNMAVESAISRALQRIEMGELTEPKKLVAELDRIETGLLGKAAVPYAGQLQGD